MAITRSVRLAACALAISIVPTLALGSAAQPAPAAHAAAALPQFQHIFVIVMENHNYEQIIGNPHAPIINKLAQQYGLATHYTGVTHPSEPNYVALIGGSYFGIQDDGPFTTNLIKQQNLGDQLTASGMTWKSYQQSLPYAGYTGVTYPTTDALYASKHNPFMNFYSVQHALPAKLAQEIVPDSQLTTDLWLNTVPNFSFITPDLCHDMHGGAKACPYADNADNPGDVNDIRLVSQGDAYVGGTVAQIMWSHAWTQGNNAIVVTWDENDVYDNPKAPESSAGCCDAVPGGGSVPTIVITNHHTAMAGFKDATPYNHYALLRTIETALGVGCLQNTCDTAKVPLMTPLFTN
ncbi:MAG TPA: alkaline phosphatase family protein [Chloroflexota bacterium]|nr:alkaline phosphatase family protein [Chloroflexota bacterium]